MATHGGRPRVVIAGGGVAALEACLALRALLSESDLAIDLLCRADRFEYQPLAVLEPFAQGAAWSMALEDFAADQDVGLVRDALSSVAPHARAVVTAGGQRLTYELLLVAVGAEPVRAIPGAVTFRGVRDADAVRAAIDAVDPGERATLAFAVPQGAFWTLPVYELAILAAARLADRGARVRVTVVTPEIAPVEAFGARASRAVGDLLQARDIDFVGDAAAIAADAGDLELADGRRLAADTVISLPRLLGRRIAGLPHDPAGFIPVDDHGRVADCDDVYAAGDITDYPLKQGGLAAQQADAAAEDMLAQLGLPIAARPFQPVLQGVLYTEHEPTYLRAPGRGHTPTPRPYSLWWPPSKIAGHYLAPYLTIRAGAPRAPEARPTTDVIPINIDTTSAVHAIRGVIDNDPVPPG